jgi:hypothetical protein
MVFSQGNFHWYKIINRGGILLQINIKIVTIVFSGIFPGNKYKGRTLKNRVGAIVQPGHTMPIRHPK